MEVVDSPSISQEKERKIRLAEELRKFGIDIDNDIAMKGDEADLESLLAEKRREERRSKMRRDWSKLATNFESWLYGCLLLSVLYLALNRFTTWLWAPYVYLLS